MSVKDAIRKYWDSRAAEYDRSPGHVALSDIWKGFLGSLFDEGLRILDVGTGTGFIALLLAELGHEVVGLDLSEGMLKVAREKARRIGVEVDFQIGDAENLPFDDETFDAVVCRHLLWTLPNPRKAIAEWVRVVKPAGRVVAIDGKWLATSPIDRITRFIGRVGIAIYERRNPWKSHYRREINRMLPFYGGSDPNSVAELFRKAGLADVSVIDLKWVREKMLEDCPFVYRLAWGGREYFAVTGLKEVVS